MSAEASGRVYVLAARRPRATTAYVINRLAQENLIDGIISVQPSGIRDALARARRIQQKGGWRALVRRWQANRLRRHLLTAYRETYLVKSLFPDGSPRLNVPRGVPVISAGPLNAPFTVRQIGQLRPRLIVQAGAGWVKQPLLDVPELGTLSLHHGIMPSIRGMDSILWACVENRPEWMGITVQLLSEGLDQGQIVSQARVEARPGENPFAIIARATVVGAELMIASVKQALAGALTPLSPSTERGTYRSALTADAVRAVYDLCAQTSQAGVR